MNDRIANFFSETTARRAASLLGFLLLLFVFRKLFVLLIFFVAFHLALSKAAGWLSRRVRWSAGLSLGVVLVVSGAFTSVLAWAFSSRLLVKLAELHQKWPHRLETIRQNEVFAQALEYFPDSEKLAESAQHYVGELARAASTAGHVLAYGLIGLILACIYFLESAEVQRVRDTVLPKTFVGTWLRWAGHLTEAVGLMIQLQLIVALVNTVLTLPILLLLGVPHVVSLMGLIFVSGLIPVIGNVISGAVLALVSYQTKGVGGVVLFVVLTFVLHKIEAYFLNPRLTARHVKLPGFMLVLSLIACEHLFGFVGLFVSFPLLFVSGKLLVEFREEDQLASAGPVEQPAADGS